MFKAPCLGLCAVAMFGVAVAASASDPFSPPQRACSALSAIGIDTQGWKASKTIPGEWLCFSSLKPFGAVGPNGMDNNIAFYVNGRSASRADDIIIKININNPSGRAEAFRRLTEATNALFVALDETPRV